MGRKKNVKDPQEEVEATCKLMLDEAANLMKIRNYQKALAVYLKVSVFSDHFVYDARKSKNCTINERLNVESEDECWMYKNLCIFTNFRVSHHFFLTYTTD